MYNQIFRKFLRNTNPNTDIRFGGSQNFYGVTAPQVSTEKLSKLDITGQLTAVGSEILLGYKKTINMNVTTDQVIPITRVSVDAGVTNQKFIITRILVTNASTSLTTAAGGVYPAASKAGTAIVAAAQAYSTLTAATSTLNLTIASNITQVLDNIYLSLTTAQGGAATADVYVFGIILP